MNYLLGLSHDFYSGQIPLGGNGAWYSNRARFEKVVVNSTQLERDCSVINLDPNGQLNVTTGPDCMVDLISQLILTAFYTYFLVSKAFRDSNLSVPSISPVTFNNKTLNEFRPDYESNELYHNSNLFDPETWFEVRLESRSSSLIQARFNPNLTSLDGGREELILKVRLQLEQSDYTNTALYKESKKGLFPCEYDNPRPYLFATVHFGAPCVVHQFPYDDVAFIDAMALDAWSVLSKGHNSVDAGCLFAGTNGGDAIRVSLISAIPCQSAIQFLPTPAYGCYDNVDFL